MDVDQPTFEALGLDPRIVSALTSLGYEEPTPIQREAIPPLLEGRDLLGQAATGTGKTAAFSLPILHRLSRVETKMKEPRALMLVPTRELAMQVAEAVHRYGRVLGLRVLPIYGGQPMYRQLHALDRGVDVVVATPGRALDHLRRGTLTLEKIECVVLDEADEMLDMGFAEDLDAILSACPEGRQTALFSATMAREILGIAENHLRDPVRVRISVELAAGEAPKVRQTAYIVHRQHKVAGLVRILDVERPTSALVFCRTRIDVDELTETLDARGYECGALHGGMSQEQRDRVMRRFREGATELLIATDVAARGLDIRQLSHVINYEVPASPDDYVHRIGRTGRAGREGVAITFVEPREHRLLRNFERLTKQKIEIGRIPTVADLRAGQLELTRAAIHEVLVAGDLERFQSVVGPLSGEFDIVEIALAAVKLAHRATIGEHQEQEIPSPQPPRMDLDPRGRRDDRGRDDRFRGRKEGGRFGRDEGPRGRDRFGDGGRDGRGDRGGDGGREGRGERFGAGAREGQGDRFNVRRDEPRTERRDAPPRSRRDEVREVEAEAPHSRREEPREERGEVREVRAEREVEAPRERAVREVEAEAPRERVVREVEAEAPRARAAEGEAETRAPKAKREEGERAPKRAGEEGGERPPKRRPAEGAERSWERPSDRPSERPSEGERGPARRDEGERSYARRDEGERSHARRDEGERSHARRDEGERGPSRPSEGFEGGERAPKRRRDEGSEQEGPRGRAPRGRQSRESGPPERWDVARMFIGLGREAGVGPSDIVGAISNESGLSSQLIGAIEIADRFSVVEVPEPLVDEIVSVLHSATLRGRKFAVRRHVDRRPTPPRTKPRISRSR